ncbi:MAG TPA: SPOR domain-containing protein [Dongiaceae bacterium]|nr:SPOR domain-containing protein [Dongiaceae bacterium]
MRRILCLAVVMSALSGPALAGMSEGVAAVTVGDYQKAIAEFQPLAAGGEPAAQYQLARIYLEGHGPADGVPQGIDLMTKAANGGHPEAQAQLGLMYAMGLGVQVDNVQAYDWLSKAVTALPDGTRRTVAEANRDAVLKRMNASQQAAVAAAAKPAVPTAPAKEAASKPAATTAKPGQEAASKPVVAIAKPAAATTTTNKTVTEAAATSKPATTATKTATTTAAAKPATTTNTAATTAKAAATETPAKTPEKPAQVASVAPAAADPKTKPTGVRIQLVSMPSEAAAWDAWKQISGKYSAQLTGLTAMVESADLGTKGTFYRVQTGPFTTVAAAQERCTAMKAAGLDCLVVGKP